jgi:hypothetical protein
MRASLLRYFREYQQKRRIRTEQLQGCVECRPPAAVDCAGDVNRPVAGQCPVRRAVCEALRRPAGVVYIYGPSGVGKTTAVRQHLGEAKVFAPNLQPGRNEFLFDGLDLSLHSAIFLDELRSGHFIGGENMSLLRLANGDTFEINAKHQAHVFANWRGRLLVMAGHDEPVDFIVDFQRRLQNPGSVAIAIDHNIVDCDGSCTAADANAL